MATLKWFRMHGGYQQLIDAYQNSSWVTRIGSGAYIQYGDSVDWKGGLFAVQTQLNLPVHAGGRTALELAGFGHNIQMGKSSTVDLFKSGKTRLPAWFTEHSWADRLNIRSLNIFKKFPNTELMKFSMGSYHIIISSPERAMIEMCALVPNYHSFEDTGHFMESLLSLRSDRVQDLLEICDSKKAKRLFLYLADVNNMPWFHKLNIGSVNLGSGKRVIAENGTFNKKYQITVPSEKKHIELKDIP